MGGGALSYPAPIGGAYIDNTIIRMTNTTNRMHAIMRHPSSGVSDLGFGALSEDGSLMVMQCSSRRSRPFDSFVSSFL